MNYIELQNAKPVYKYHHDAYARGYVSRKLNEEEYPCEKYDGKFGKGYIVKAPCWNTSTYYAKVYYIRQEFYIPYEEYFDNVFWNLEPYCLSYSEVWQMKREWGEDFLQQLREADDNDIRRFGVFDDKTNKIIFPLGKKEDK